MEYKLSVFVRNQGGAFAEASLSAISGQSHDKSTGLFSFSYMFLAFLMNLSYFCFTEPWVKPVC